MVIVDASMKNYYLATYFVYLYTALSILPIIIFFGFVLGLSVYANHTLDGIPVYFFPYLLLLGIGAVLFTLYKSIHEHIAVSENGIEYHSPWSILETNWGSIEKISYGWHNQWRLEGLLVDTFSIRIKRHSLLDRYLPVFSSQRMIIPLSCFSNNWRESELGEQIKQYAPQLFP